MAALAAFASFCAVASAAHPLAGVPIDDHARLGESKIRLRQAYDFTLRIVRTMCSSIR